jgi:hypothetical protein
MKSNPVLAALAIAGGALCLSTPALADPAAAQRLASLLRDHVQRQEVPPLAAGATVIYLIGQQRLQMDANQLRQMVATQRGMITAYRIEEFRVHAADCGPDLCWIRYGYRFSARTGATSTAGEVSNQEWWIRNGDTFALSLGVSRQ